MATDKVFDLWYIVASCKADLDLDSTKHDLRFLKWAIDGFRDLNESGVLETYKSVRLTVNKNGTVDLPDDYEDYTKVGLCEHGYIINFVANDTICLVPPKVDCCLDAVKEAERCCRDGNFGAGGYLNDGWYGNQWYYLPSFHNGQFTAGIYGLGAGFYNAGFRVNDADRTIQFDKFLCAKEIILEYRSNGGIDKGNAYIPDFAIKALRHYVHWQRCMFSRDPLEKRDTEMHRFRYQRNLKRIVAQINALTASELLDIVRSSFHQAAKR